MPGRTLTRAGLLLVLLAFLGLHGAAIFTTAFNWDEFALLDRVARAAADGVLRASGHPGLSEVMLSPLVADCRDEVATGRSARGLWLAITLVYLAGIGALLLELFRDRAHRLHDAAVGVALLGLTPAFLEWSLQVRSDQIALAGAAWGGAALLASRRRPVLAVAAGLGFGIGCLSSQKALYVAALMALLALGQLSMLRDLRPRRDALRALLTLLTLNSVVFAYERLIGMRFTLPEQHPIGALPETALVQRHLDVFHFYRHTIGISQYVDMLPTLIPHLALLALLVAATLPALRARGPRAWLALAWAVLGLGLAVGIFHAAAFAYFWMTLGLFPALALASALAPFRALLRLDAGRRLQIAAALLWVGIALPAGFHTAELLRDTQAVQRESLAFVRRNFAPHQAGFQPEAALFCGPEQPLGTWMSFLIYEKFGGETRENNTRYVLRRFREAHVYYLVESFRLNQFPLELRRFWAENYQPYRASVFVAGRRFEAAAGETRSFEIVAPGDYRWLPLRGRQPLQIGAARVAAGGLIALEAGAHTAAFPEDVPAGLLVLALDEPPGPAPLAFYKTY
ncbi:MAG: hypothetical protein OEY15_13140 [Myxococcales bacterium]|nr:hypothetical protein [Myxococcales bacterium]